MLQLDEPPAGAAEGDEPRLDGGVLVVVEVAEQVLRTGPLGDHDVDHYLAQPERAAGRLDAGVLARDAGEHGEGGAHREGHGASSPRADKSHVESSHDLVHLRLIESGGPGGPWRRV
jgi:hypothetical protein